MTFYPLNQIRQWWSSRWQWGAINHPRYISTLYGKQSPSLVVDERNVLQAYLDCSLLNTVINKRAEMLSNGQWKVVTDDEEETELTDSAAKEILQLLSQPNPLQNGEEWLFQYGCVQGIFNNNFIYKLRPTSISEPKCLWHLPTQLMQVKFTGKWYQQSDLTKIVEKYELNIDGKLEPFKVNDIIWKANNRGSDLMGQSVIPSLQFPISNIMAAQKSLNIISVNKGAIGVLSAENRDGDGVLPLGSTEKKELETQLGEDWNLWNSQRSKVNVSSTPVKWSPITFPTKDLIFLEQIDSFFGNICAALGMKRDMFPGQQGATFENQKMAEQSTYQGTIQPLADDLARTLTRELGLEGRKLILDYSWLPVMQEDQEIEAQREANKVTALHQQFADGVITNEEYRQQLGLEPMPEVDFSQSQLEKIINAQVELRGTVGGTTGLIAVNDAVSQGRLDRDAAVAIVVNIYGFEQSVAETMITRTINPPQETNPLREAA